MKILCDICGGELIIGAGGEYAVCEVCGMKHSVERLREKIKSETPVEKTVAQVPVSNEIVDAEIVDAEIVCGDDELNLSGRSAEMLHDDIAAYLKNPVFAQYSIKENVSIQVFGGNENCMPINFLFMKYGKPYLAVAILKGSRRKHGAVTGTIDICKKMGIKYIDFFASMPNTESYVMTKIMKALEE